METIYAYTLISAALIFGICGAGTAVAFGNLGGKLIESSARQPELSPKLQTQFFLIAGYHANRRIRRWKWGRYICLIHFPHPFG